MPTIDPIKNLIFVKESQARRKDKIGVEEFNRIHSNDQSNYRDNQRQKKGEEEYKKKNADYMKAYRLAKKPQQQDIKTPAANILQNAFRNKLARKTIIKVKQDKANELISQLNQQRQLTNMNVLKTKLSAGVMANDILNNIFPSVINTNYPIRSVGRPRLSDEERLRREQIKQSKPKGKVGRPRKNN